jgi:septal ring factor EnvC (AmiA/AmiB activator)
MKFLKAVLIVMLVLAAFAVHAQPTSNDLKRQRDQLTQQLEQLNHEYEQTVNNKKTTLAQLNLLKKQISLREDKINNINTSIRNLDNQISESNSFVHNLQNQLDLLKRQYAAMVLFTYHNQSSYNKLMFIFAAKDFNQSYKRLKYLQQIGTYRERQAEYIHQTQVELHVKINELDQSKKEKSNLLVDQEKEKETLGKEKNDQVQVVADLSKHQGILQQQTQDIQRKIAKTNREINAAIRREIEEARRKAEEEERARAAAAAAAAAKARAENKPAVVAERPRVAAKAMTTSEVLNATPEAAKLSNDFLGNRGSLPWPVTNGVLLQGFGTYMDAANIKNESLGWDIRTNAGASVRAVFQGTVKSVSNISGTYLVVIQHGEYFTAYSNLKSCNVKIGDKVVTKQSIGTVATESSTGQAVVTFELWKGSTPVNPRIWLAASN